MCTMCNHALNFACMYDYRKTLRVVVHVHVHACIFNRNFSCKKSQLTNNETCMAVKALRVF